MHICYMCLDTCTYLPDVDLARNDNQAPLVEFIRLAGPFEPFRRDEQPQLLNRRTLQTRLPFLRTVLLQNLAEGRSKSTRP